VALQGQHKEAQVGGDQYRLRRGDKVLWYFADFASGENTGAELELRTPAHVPPTQPFGVRALAYDASGRTTPASGMQIWGGATAITDAKWWASVEAPRAGAFAPAGRLWQRHPGRLDDEVRQREPRAPSSDAWRADSRHERAADSITGTAGADVVSARGGGPRRRGPRWTDAVSCGAGTDYVRASGNDRVRRDCDRVARV
jgi:hypothetical protein